MYGIYHKLVNKGLNKEHKLKSQSMVTDHTGMKLGSSNRRVTRKSSNVWKSGNT